MGMQRLTRFVLGHRLLVVVLWSVVLVAGVAASSSVTDRLSTQFSFPGQPGYEANTAILRHYGTGGPTTPLVPVVTLSGDHTASDPAVRSSLVKAFARLDEDPRLRVVSSSTTGDDAFIADHGQTVFALVYPPPGDQNASLADLVQQRLDQALPAGTTVRVTGVSQLSAQAAESGGSTGVLVETLVAAGGALVVLALVFGSLLALLPMLVAGVSILSTFLAVLGLTTFTDVSFLVQFLIALIGLGVAIDYSLLLVTRWREERGRGRDNDDAVRVAMSTAGRSVVFSGVTVALGLVVLVLVPVPFLRSVGYAGALIPAVSVLVTLTLLPALLSKVGPRVDWPRRRARGRGARRTGRVWTRWAGLVVRHRWVAAGAALAVLAPLVVAATTIRLGTAPSDALPGDGPARVAVQHLSATGVPSGVLTPIEVLVPGGEDPQRVATTLDGVDGVFAATPATGTAAGAPAALVDVLPRHETSTDAGQDTLATVRDVVAERFPRARVGGSGAQLVDAVDALYSNIIWLLVVVAAVAFVLLARAFRSFRLAAQAVLLNVVSIAAAYGAAVLIWQDGFGSQLLFGYHALGSITFWVPLITFAFLFGLSMDYEVFLLSRMRETYDESGSLHTAVVEGLGRVGRLVTGAAVILFLAFVSLSAVPAVDVKVMATTLGIGILLDATVVRGVLVPAVTALTGIGVVRSGTRHDVLNV